MENQGLIKEIFYDSRIKEPIDENIIKLTNKAIETSLEQFAFDAGWQVSVSFVEAQEIQALNKKYRDVDSVTDVLSFPMEEKDERGVDILGDVVICTDRAKSQAEEFGHSQDREIAYLCVHSVLHLLGYDHMEEEDRVEMRSMEKIIMKKLGIFKNDTEYAN